MLHTTRAAFAAAVISFTSTASAFAQEAPAGNRWTGPYGGLHVGHVSEGSSTHQNPNTGRISALSDDGGPIGGAKIGWNFTFNQLLVGLEADASAGGTDAIGFCFNTVRTCETHIDNLVTVRARAGLLLDEPRQLLAYVTGGAAFADVELESFRIGGGGAIIAPREDSKWVSGWTVGGGLEGFLDETDRISLFAEYLYVDLPEETYNAGTATPFLFEAELHVVRVGINAHLN